MEPNSWIKESKWLCTPEGFAIAEKVCNLYFKEYDRENNRLYGKHFS